MNPSAPGLVRKYGQGRGDDRRAGGVAAPDSRNAAESASRASGKSGAFAVMRPANNFAGYDRRSPPSRTPVQSAKVPAAEG